MDNKYNLSMNGWMVVLVTVVMVLGYGFAAVNMKLLGPAIVAQVAGNGRLIQAINRDFSGYNQGIQQRLGDLTKRVDALDGKTAPAPQAQVTPGPQPIEVKVK